MSSILASCPRWSGHSGISLLALAALGAWSSRYSISSFAARWTRFSRLTCRSRWSNLARVTDLSFYALLN